MLWLPDDMKVDALQEIIDWLNGQTLYIKLYKNNVTLDGTQTYGSFTEADFTGYSDTNNVLGAFGTISVDGSHRAVSAAPTKTYVETGTGTTCDVYGFYIHNSANELRWAEKYVDAPVAMNEEGKPFFVLPRLELDRLVY